ncbi:MAG: DUF5693 family protein, partial [bacterium]
MKKNIKYFLAGVLIIAVVAAAGLTLQRLVAETNNNRVAIIMDYSDLQKLSLLEGQPIGKILSDFKKIGLTSIAITEDTPETLQQNGIVAWFPASDIILSQGFSNNSNAVVAELVAAGNVKPESQIIIAGNANTFNELKDEFSIMLNPSQIMAFPAYNMLSITDDAEDLKDLGVGMRSVLIEALKIKNFKIVPRLRNNFRYTP